MVHASLGITEDLCPPFPQLIYCQLLSLVIYLSILMCSSLSSPTKYFWIKKMTNSEIMIFFFFLCLSESTCKPQTYLLENSVCTAIFITKKHGYDQSIFLSLSFVLISCPWE